MNEGLFRGTRPVPLSTNPDEPAEGRTFVWAWTEWFERLEGEDGNVAFEPVASSQKELDEWLIEQNEPLLTQLEGEFAAIVVEEFLDQASPYPGEAELSSEEPFREQETDADSEYEE